MLNLLSQLLIPLLLFIILLFPAFFFLAKLDECMCHCCRAALGFVAIHHMPHYYLIALCVSTVTLWASPRPGVTWCGMLKLGMTACGGMLVCCWFYTQKIILVLFNYCICGTFLRKAHFHLYTVIHICTTSAHSSYLSQSGFMVHESAWRQIC